MSCLYNDNEPTSVEWLRCLIKEGLIPDGHVDDRSIEDVTAADLEGFTQCHFFAGIAGWPYALQLAGWPEGREVWTASCPCQPFSSAGKRKGFDDARHLWPVFVRLVAERRPPIVFGEQVASKAGREWLARARGEMEALGYAVGAADLCAAGIGAPHIRQRLFWVAYASGTGLAGRSIEPAREERQAAERSGDARGMGDTNGNGRTARSLATKGTRHGLSAVATGGGAGGRLGDTNGVDEKPQQTVQRIADVERARGTFWDRADYLRCIDGKYRPVEPGTFPLAYGLSPPVAQLRGLGNAIVPQLAAAFIQEACEAIAS